MMAGLEHTQFEFLPEKIQTLSGSVHQTYSLLEETDYGDSVYIPVIDSSVPIYTTARDYHLYPDMYAPMAKVLTLQDLYGPLIKKDEKGGERVCLVHTRPRHRGCIPNHPKGKVLHAFGCRKRQLHFILKCFGQHKKREI